VPRADDARTYLLRKRRSYSGGDAFLGQLIFRRCVRALCEDDVPNSPRENVGCTEKSMLGDVRPYIAIIGDLFPAPIETA
jgi:hypothetical protein